jgi:AcrR family transcriptional regulator
MNSEPRWQRRKADRPAEILAAALDCFAERGVAATRMEDVARRAGVTKGTLYLYFPTKEELFKAVVRAELLPAVGLLEAAAEEPVPAAEVLRRLVTVWAERVVGSRFGVLPKLVISEVGNFPELGRFYLDEVISRARNLLRKVIRRGVESGEFREIDVDQVVYCVIGPLLLSVLWRHSFERFDDRPMDAAALCRTHLDLLLNGLRPTDRSARRPRPNGESRRPKR